MERYEKPIKLHGVAQTTEGIEPQRVTIEAVA